MAKYIFPGADASRPLHYVIRALERADFEIHSVENIGIHYSQTIRCWYHNWLKNRDAITAKYGERWFRIWEIFLAWSIIIARQGSSTCFQIVANKNLNHFDRTRFVGTHQLG
jgi:cyclopropane fatty-acyl-phospholipid synthase-like methyltransferase